MKNKKSLLLIALAVVVIGTIGLTYALYSRAITGRNTELVAGDIYMHYNETKEVMISNAMPSATYSEDQTPFEFNITGKNTNSDNDIWYEIVLTHGKVPDGKQEENRIDDKYLKFTLIETKSESESLPVNETVVNGESYDDLSEGKRIWVNEIPRETTDETKISYKLYMWISDEVKVGNTSDAVYDTDRWNNAFASVKINVTGDFEEKKLESEGVIASGALIEKVGTGGLIGINPEVGSTCSSNCKEYRYSGTTVSNYVKLKNKQTSDGVATEELWRIIGIFSETKEDGTEEKYMKLIRNENLQESYFPDQYIVNGTTYTIKDTGQNVYWNKIDNSLQDGNNWSSSGIQYYLNTLSDDNGDNMGYMSYLSDKTKKLLQKRTYYLGNLKSSSQYNEQETAVTTYNSERNVSKNATWEGEIALMYPSDYGFSADKQYWQTPYYQAFGFDFLKIDETSWIKNNTWLISPTSSNNFVTIISCGGSGAVCNYSASQYSYGIAPVLNLRSDVKITNLDTADGSLENPYELGV